jgi:hypothetical protein
MMAGRLSGLTPSAHLVLVGMAVNAHDTGTATLPAACYFRGWEHLSIWLGYDKYDATAERAVCRAVAGLTRRGLVEVVARRGGNRGPVVYRLHLDVVPGPKP